MYYLLRYYKEETQLVGLKLKIWGYQQATTDVFTFPEEILKTKTSLFWVFAASKEMK